MFKKSIFAFSLSVFIFSTVFAAEQESPANLSKICAENEVNYVQAQVLVKYIQKIINTLPANNEQQAREISLLIKYPLLVNNRAENGKLLHMQVNNQKEFVGQYKQIFTDAMKQEMLKADPRDIFCNANGGMAANGAIWFGGKPVKIFSINIENNSLQSK